MILAVDYYLYYKTNKFNFSLTHLLLIYNNYFAANLFIFNKYSKFIFS